MSKSSSEPVDQAKATKPAWVVPLLAFSAWLLIGYELSNWIVREVIVIVQGLFGPITQYMSLSIANNLAGFLLYGVMIALVIWLPVKLLKQPVSRELLGLEKMPTFVDVALGPLGIIVTLIGGAFLTWGATQLFPGFDAQQAQNVGLNATETQVEIIISFLLLIIVGPFVEELIFRGYLYGTFLRYNVPDWLAMVAVSVLFGIVHQQWNVGLIVFCLSMAACAARKYTGSIWAGVVMHMIKNGMAFYMLLK